MNNNQTPARRRPRKTTVNSPATKGLDLSSLFSVAGQALAANQGTLNQADAQNGNHGDNMVQIFNMISQAVGENQGASPSQQLSHASQVVAQNAHSGSAQVYSQGLAQAAQQFQGQQAVTPSNAGTLIQALLGGGAQTSGGGVADMIGSVLAGGGQATSGGGQMAGTGAGDLLGGLLGGDTQSSGGGMADLLGGLLGGGTSQQTSATSQTQNDGIDMGDVLNAGMAFMNAKQQGQGNLQAGLSALMAAGPMGQSSHRQESGQLVASALMQAVAAMSKRQ